MIKCSGYVFLVVSAVLALANAGDSARSHEHFALRSPLLNFEIDHLLRGRYFDEVRRQDEVTVRYGTMNTPTSISINGTLNIAACVAATQDIANLYYPRMLPNATYQDFDINGVPLINFAGTTEVPMPNNPLFPFGFQFSIARGLSTVLCATGLYGQYHNLGAIIVNQVDEDTFNVGGTCSTTGYIPNNGVFNPLLNTTAVLYPTSVVNLIKYTNDGERYHEYKRVIAGDHVEFKLSRIEGFNRFATFVPRGPADSSGSVLFPERTYTGL